MFAWEAAGRADGQRCRAARLRVVSGHWFSPTGAHRPSCPEHTLERLPAGHRAGRGRARVRRPADPRRAPGLHPRRPARPDQQRPGPGQRGHPGRAGAARLRRRGTGPAQPRPRPPRPGCSPSTGCSPTVRAAGRPLRLLIETKHPTRYGSEVEDRLVALLARHGLTVADPADPVRVTVMSFSPLARPSGAYAGSAVADGVPVRGGHAGSPGRSAPVRGADSRPRLCPCSRPGRSWSSGPTSEGTRCSCGP